MKKIRIFFLALTVILVAQLFTACSSSKRYYDSPQDWKNGNNYAGTWDDEGSMAWFMQTALVDVVYNNVNQVKNNNQSAEEMINTNVSTFDTLPLIKTFGERNLFLGIVDNPDPYYELDADIYEISTGYKVLDITLEKNEPGKNFRAKTYLLPGKYKIVLKSHNGSVLPVEFEFEVTGFLGSYKGMPCYWSKYGGTGNWGQY